MKKNIVLCGMPSSGKTTLGKLVAEKLGLDYVDTDAAIVSLEGREITEIFKTEGEEYFRQTESRVVEEVSKLSGMVISLGGGAVLRKENVESLRQNGLIFFIDRNLELLTPTADRPLSSNIDALKTLYAERKPLYESVSDYTIENNGAVEKAVEEIIGNFVGSKNSAK